MKNLIGDIVIVGDLGEIKAYEVKEELVINPKDNAHTSHKHNKGELIDRVYLDLLLAVDFIEARKRLSEELSDKVGRKKSPAGARESGEPHNLKLEIENRLLKEIASLISKTIRDKNPKKWHLAFPTEHNKALLDRLDNDTKTKLDKNLSEDLTKLKPQKLLEKFQG